MTHENTKVNDTATTKSAFTSKNAINQIVAENHKNAIKLSAMRLVPASLIFLGAAIALLKLIVLPDKRAENVENNSDDSFDEQKNESQKDINISEQKNSLENGANKAIEVFGSAIGSAESAIGNTVKTIEETGSLLFQKASKFGSFFSFNIVGETETEKEAAKTAKEEAFLRAQEEERVINSSI